MRRTGLQIAATVTAITVAFTAAVPGAALADEKKVLDYCLDRPASCALSVVAVDEGWERHWNADRPQVLASTFKILVLLAYAQAVQSGAVDPDDTVAKEEWGRYFSGGSSLETSWNDLGNPERVRLDDLARVMIVNSDNSAPDLFLATLKKRLVKRATKLFDWHDAPAGISSMFGLWQNLNGVGGTGNRIATDYGGFDVKGYQKELQSHARSLRRDAFVETVRRNLCAQPPWVTGEAPCDPPQPITTQANFVELENEYFNRGTTRAYAEVMRKLLERTLLPPTAQEVVERNLEQGWFDRFGTLSNTYTRFGLKGGNLATGAGEEILTWAHYMETAGGRYVVVVFLRQIGGARRAPDGGDVNEFAQKFAVDAPFRQRVRDAFDDGPLDPELVPQIRRVTRNGSAVTVKARVFNTSLERTDGPFKVSLYLLDDADPQSATPVATAQVGAIQGGKRKNVTLRHTGDGVAGKLAVLLIDSDEEIPEQDEENNLTWERLGG